MEKYLFDRFASLKIGKAGQTGIVIEGLRIAFDIAKTSSSESNTCSLIVNNLSDTTRASLRADTGIICELTVGYQELGSKEIIFVGDIVNVTNDIVKPEVTTTITCEDGSTYIKSKKVKLSFQEGTKLATIVDALISSLGFPVEAKIDKRFKDRVIPNVEFINGFSFEGYAASVLDDLCQDNGIEWSIQNHHFKIYSKKSTDNSSTLATQLIGSPKRINKKVKEGSKEDAFKGWEFSTLLAPKAAPGGKVTLDSKVMPASTKLKIVEVKHSGDTHGNEWISVIRAEDI